MRYFDELDGQIEYRSSKFDLSLLARKIEGKTLIIDFSSLAIKYRKRANQSISSPHHHPRTMETIMTTMALHMIIHYIADSFSA